MEKREESEKISNASLAIGLKLFGRTIYLTGLWAVAALILLLVLVCALAYLLIAKTEPRLLLSAALWILFIAYWSAAAKQSATTASSESPASRQLHQLLMYGALFLAFLPVPGLTRRW